MNATNRALNRIVLFLIGLVLLAVGAVVVAVMAWPTAADVWTANARAAQEWLQQTVRTTPIEGTSGSWLEIAVLAADVVIVALLVFALTRIGGRRTSAIARSSAQATSAGRVVVSGAFAADALQSALASREDLVTSHVRTVQVGDRPILHVDVSPRQNTSPREVLDDVDRLVDNLAALTGREISAYVSIRGGLRTALARDRRRIR